MTADRSVKARLGRSLDVLVVDDSAVMRHHLRLSLEEAGHTVRIARDGEDALVAIAKQKPDVVTLDVHMPKMDGLACLGHIMATTPVPVVMVSSVTSAGAKTTLDALQLGAVDYISKPGGAVSDSIAQVKAQLLPKVEAAARQPVLRRPRPTPAFPEQLEEAWRTLQSAFESPSSSLQAIVDGGTRGSRPARAPKPVPVRPVFSVPAPSGHPVLQSPPRAPRGAREAAVLPRRSIRGGVPRLTELVLVGVSTGGPGTLETILTELSSDFPAPIVIAQHMPANFTAKFAGSLARACSLNVMEITTSEALHPGTVYIARGGHDLVIRRRQGQLVGVSVASDPARTWHPNVGRMVASAMRVVASTRIIAVQLTGMGDDGAHEMAEVHARGGRTIAQSEDSCAVYGMPRALVALKAATAVLDPPQIGRRLLAWVTEGWARKSRHWRA